MPPKQSNKFFDWGKYGSQYKFGTAAEGTGSLMTGYKDVMSLYNLSKLGQQDFMGQSSSVLGSLSVLPTPAAPYLKLASFLTGMFGGRARHGLRG